MLALLTGDRRHHSYDEVMCGSHAIPDHHRSHLIPGHHTEWRLKYNFPTSYNDVLWSAHPKVKNSAERALNATIEQIKEVPKNSVLQQLKTEIYSTRPEDWI